MILSARTVLTTLLATTITVCCLRSVSAQTLKEHPLIVKVDELAATALDKPGAVGFSLAIARGDRIILSKAYGKADLENAVPATEDSVFRIASVTKQFTAAAILHLAEQHKLALDDDIARYVSFPTPHATITVRHLLSHTSGIKNYTDLPDFFDTVAPRDLFSKEVLDLVRGQPLDFEPGTKWAYSNTNYHLLGMIIEKVSGAPYAEYLQREFFTPLGLTHTRYDTAADIIPHRARGYALINGAPANASHLSMTIPFAAGGLLSTARDLVQWQLALQSGRVISPASYKQMTTPGTLTDGSSTRYGYGLFLDEIDGHPNTMHEGGIPGFNSILVHFTKEDLTIAVLSNSPATSAGLLAARVAEAAFALEVPTVHHYEDLFPAH